VALSFDPDEIGVSKSYKPQYSSTELTAYNLTLEYEFGGAVLTSSTNYFETYSKQENDLSGILAATPFGFPWGMVRDDEHENLIQEIRLVSTGDSKLSWVVGAYYADRQTDYGQIHTTTEELASARGLTGFLTNPSISTSDPVFIDAAKRVNVDKETAFFGEVGYELTEDVKLTVGLRTGETEVHDTRFAQGIEGISPMIQTNLRWFMGQAGAMPALDVYELGVTVEPAMRPYGELQDDGTYANQVWAVQKDYSTFKAALAWQARENINLYGMLAKGFRGPQINGAATTNGGVSPVDPTDFVIQPSSDSDSLINYEVGMKAKWLDGRLQTNVTAYLLVWEDMQQQTVRTSDAASFISNAGAAESKGLEIEVRALLSEKIDLGLSVSTLDAHLTEMSAAEEALTGYEIGVSDQMSAPEFTASGYIQYTTSGFGGNELYLRADAQHVGGFPIKSGFQAGKPGVVDPLAVDTDSYENLNISMGLTAPRWSASVYAENLLNNEDLIYIYPAVFLGSRYGTLRPRTVGLRLSYRL
jgi:outer membrane receptor protein involved in Fe transport